MIKAGGSPLTPCFGKISVRELSLDPSAVTPGGKPQGCILVNRKARLVPQLFPGVPAASFHGAEQELFCDHHLLLSVYLQWPGPGHNVWQHSPGPLLCF